MLDTYRYKVDFSEIQYYIEIHEALKRDLDFPDYYGGNLYALWDCLTDQLSNGLTYVEFYNSEKILKQFSNEWQRIIEVFKDTKHAWGNKYSNRFFVTIVHEDGTREEIE